MFIKAVMYEIKIQFLYDTILRVVCMYMSTMWACMSVKNTFTSHTHMHHIHITSHTHMHHIHITSHTHTHMHHIHITSHTHTCTTFTSITHTHTCTTFTSITHTHAPHSHHITHTCAWHAFHSRVWQPFHPLPSTVRNTVTSLAN